MDLSTGETTASGVTRKTDYGWLPDETPRREMENGGWQKQERLFWPPAANY